MNKFKIGDVVMLSKELYEKHKETLQFYNEKQFIKRNPDIAFKVKATIIDTSFERAELRYGLKFNKNIEGHDLGGRVKYGYGWWLPETCLVLAKRMTKKELAKQKQQAIEEKCRKLWNQSKYVKSNPSFTY